jgi:indolepyruvate ferredoxin oxidoreductase
MAYKDEYEVARLFVDPAFTAQLREQFQGEPGKDYQVHFHLAPPLLARKDENGHLVKRRFGPWMGHAFKILARCKGLRGTLLDPFGQTRERRTERQLISDYLDLIDELAQTLNHDNRAAAIALASLPDDIRGFGHVKERNIEAAATRRAQLLEQYRGAAPERQAA